ncbi:hypothetical protein [Fulvivirga lutea]|uniref:Uncharacterized protein n=1 Tax=Fulvivirga lutea TaxID=2810512 RepID=A0A975A0T0_9BACT|nr:hypothetical protein [Fulvivirga lutea]QSE97525.1 hypothetical protein JR347_00100 [Fulvivirga lutea]
MKLSSNISRFKHSAGIAMGLLAALVILVSQSFYFEYVSNFEQSVSVEQTSDNSDDSEDQVIKMGHQALSSAVEFSIQSVLHFITHIYDENPVEKPLVSENINGLTSYFQTLFRLIISPNAP